MPVDIAGRRAARIAKVGADALWWIAGLGAVVVATLFLLSPLILGSGMNQVTVQVSVGGDQVARAVPLPSTETSRASEFVLEERDATHHLQFRTTDWRMMMMVNWVFLPLLALLLVAIHLIRSFLAAVMAAEVFTRVNAARLSKLGWLAIAVGVAGPALQYWRSWIVLRQIEFDAVALSPARPEWIDGSIFFGVLLLVLASAWRYGVELQQERDLTV